ncbi:MAG: CSLREA domain-containing protein [Nitrospinota bacterium]|nr:CSLREA domain-containing protein [Nitrospinota bacterium]
MRNRFGFLAGIFYFILLIHAPGAWAAVIGVTTTADTVAADTSCSLREAVNNVNSVGVDTTGGDCVISAGADTISIPAGTYTLTGASGDDANLSGDLDILQSVTITGAGAGSTIINGGGIDRVIHVTAAVTATIGNVTITGGSADSGAGMYIVGGIITISNSTFSGNTTTAGHGGGMFVNAGTLTISNSTFSGNTATNAGGGGVFVNAGTLAISNSTFSGNTATNGGGGVSTGSGSSTISNSTFSGNTTSSGGGGVYARGVTTLSNSTFSGNKATSGGGIYNSGTLTVTNSAITGNSVTSLGGGVFDWLLTSTTLTNTTVSGNHSKSDGGGLYNFGALTLTNCTITGNTAGKICPGIYRSGSVSASNSIIAGNVGTLGNCGSGGITTNGYNIDSDGTCGFTGVGDISNSTTILTYLGALANNGGPTMTRALLSGSPAIDMGSCVNGADQRGTARPQGSTCDMGAYEADQVLLTTAIGGPGAGTITGGFVTNCPGVCSEYFMKNGVVSLTATATAPAVFFGWTGTGSCDGMVTNPCSVTMNAAKTATALFSKDGLIVTVTGPGTVTDGAAISCPTTACAEPAGPGAAYNLTATPTGAAVFTGWTVTGGSVGDTCAGANTPCMATVPAPGGGVVYATAKFDLYGCTSATATNYNPSATINDGSCVFPAGGGGGGGLDNQPPYFPGGGQWLISPEDKANGNGDTPFVWKILSDLDGDTVTYYLYTCSGADYTDCKVIDMVVGNEDQNHRYAYGLGASGVALLLIGFGFTHGGRRRMLVAIAALALTGSGALIACGAGGGSGNDGVLVSACTEAGPDSLCREMFNLAPGDYQWKVTGEDGRGGLIESEARNFTVK